MPAVSISHFFPEPYRGSPAFLQELLRLIWVLSNTHPGSGLPVSEIPVFPVSSWSENDGSEPPLLPLTPFLLPDRQTSLVLNWNVPDDGSVHFPSGKKQWTGLQDGQRSPFPYSFHNRKVPEKRPTAQVPAKWNGYGNVWSGLPFQWPGSMLLILCTQFLLTCPDHYLA